MPFYRPQRKNLLIKGIKHIPSKTLLYAGEGFGKSSQTVMYLTKERGKKVIFSCLSNKQIEEQTESFGKQGLKVQTIHSREYIIKTKHNVEPVMLPPAHPWASNILDETKTRQAFLDAGYTQEKTDEIWDVLENNLLEPDFDNHDIVITTHARLRVWGMAQKKRVGHVKDKALASGLFDDKLIVDRGTCIIFDDPTIDEFMKFKKFDKRYETVVVDKERLKVVTIGGENGKKERRYFVRPQSYEATFGLRSVHWFFTTTELLVAYLISNLFPETKVPKLLPDVPMTTEGAKITVIRSKIVRSKCDGVLPVVFERLKKEEYKCEFFANGMGNEFNLTNSKGQNIFSDLDTIIEISLPHEDEAIVLADCLGTDNRQLVRETIALDALHQAIGRNCGYRSSDKTYTQDGQAIETRKCVVLIEPRLCNGILKRMRYCVAQLVEGDKYVQGQSKRDYTRFEDAVLWFVRNWESFLFRGITKKGKGSHREFEVCVRLAAVNCPADRRKTRAKRMLKMVDTLMKETKLEERAKRLDSVALTVISAFKAENWEKSVPNA